MASDLDNHLNGPNGADTADTDSTDANNGETRCARCRREIRLGGDTLVVDQGVLGPRGFIPLERRLYFCSEQCAGEHFYDPEFERRPQRIP